MAGLKCDYYFFVWCQQEESEKGVIFNEKLGQVIWI